MKNFMKCDHANSKLIMDKTFAKNAEIVGSREYEMLQAARKDYPHYEVVRRQIKKNAKQEHYHGLTYEYMTTYIAVYEPEETREAKLNELSDLIMISKCHSKGYRYPTIRNWFLEQYPEVKQFGMPSLRTGEDSAVSVSKSGEIIPMPQEEQAIAS